MPRELSPEEQKAVGFVLAIVMVVASAIIISRQLFPFFLVGAVILFVILIVVGLIEIFFRDHSYLDIWDYFSVYIGVALLIFMIGTGITYGIGYGIGNSSFGQASLEVYYSITGAEQELQNSINQIVEESCKRLPEESCRTLRETAKTAETLKEVSDLAEKLGKTSQIVGKVS